MATWLTLSQITTRLARILTDDATTWDTSSPYSAAIQIALDQAEGVIRQVLAERELTPAQQDAWAGGDDYQYDIATYFFLRDYYAARVEAEAIPAAMIERYNRIDELRLATFVDATGAVIEPAVIGEGARLIEPASDRDSSAVHDYPFLNPRVDKTPPWPGVI